MRPSVKSAALACAAILLVGATAVASQGSSGSTSAAADRGSTAVTFKAGERGDTFEVGALWSLDVKPGLYNVSMRATLFVQPSDPNATSAWTICGVVDLNTFTNQAPNTRIYFADSSVAVANGAPAAMSGSSTVHVTPDMTPGVVCYVGSGSLILYQPISVTFTTLAKRTYGDATSVPLPGRGKLLKRAFGIR